VLLFKKKLFYENDMYSFIFQKRISQKYEKKCSQVMISCYHLSKRILWKLYLLYNDYLFSQKYKKCSPGKYPFIEDVSQTLIKTHE